MRFFKRRATPAPEVNVPEAPPVRTKKARWSAADRANRERAHMLRNTTASPKAKTLVDELGLTVRNLDAATNRAGLHREQYRGWRRGKIAPLSQAQRAFRTSCLDQIEADEREISRLVFRVTEMTRRYWHERGRPMTADLAAALRSADVDAVRVNAHAGRVNDGLEVR